MQLDLNVCACAHGLPAGVHIPTEAAVYEPILEMLAEEGLGFQEESTYSAA
jgi:hypothetical protein